LNPPEHLISGSDTGQKGVVSAPLGAILLSHEVLSADEQNLGMLLDFFGIPWKIARIGEMPATSGDGSFTNYCILSSASCLAAALEDIPVPEAHLPSWILNAKSVYVHDFQETTTCTKLFRYLTGAANGAIRKPAAPEARMTVAPCFTEICGPMSGLQFLAKQAENSNYFDASVRGADHQSIISSDNGDKFVSVTREGVRFFLNVSSGILDIGAPAPGYFDVKDHFLSAVPIVMYLKWAFSEVAWRGMAETPACLIVDDPLLKPRYGFLRFADVLEQMDRFNFTTSIAFIPWNWSRTHRETIQQFKSRPDRLSLCIHGCDHSRGEFAARSSSLLNTRIKTAKQRMQSLFQKTSLPYDEIMVFPQGMFSPETGRALKLNGIVAAVNTEVAPSGGATNETKISDLWDVAIMKYGSFPIFTRRYLSHGVENFAFDALLGKPCLIVAHHDVFKDRGKELMGFIGRLNSLKWNLRWCSLGEVIRHSFKIRNGVNGTYAIKMYANHLEMDNPLDSPVHVIVTKEEGESDPLRVEAVKINQEFGQYSCEGGELKFEVMVRPRETMEVGVTYFDEEDQDSAQDSFGYTTKMGLRRYLSEFRDNYISQNDFVYAAAAKFKRFLN
jgi:hypothetical protein